MFRDQHEWQRGVDGEQRCDWCTVWHSDRRGWDAVDVESAFSGARSAVRLSLTVSAETVGVVSIDGMSADSGSTLHGLAGVART